MRVNTSEPTNTYVVIMFTKKSCKNKQTKLSADFVFINYKKKYIF